MTGVLYRVPNMWRRLVIALLAIVILGVTAVAILLRTIGFNMLIPPAGVLYPPAPAMPTAMPQGIDDFLARFERILSEQAPRVLSSLQAGLTDVQIDEIEVKHSFKLPPDLRALYRWRNGTARNFTLDAFPGHRFVPLDEALAEREVVRQQVKSSSLIQQQAFAALAGHRHAWLGVIVDLAGDGYFFDPGRTEDCGSFLLCFAEDANYIFYPAFRNFLAAIIEGHGSGVFGFGDLGAETIDFQRAEAIWLRFGARPPR